MKKVLILTTLALGLAGCASNAPQTANTNANIQQPTVNTNSPVASTHSAPHSSQANTTTPTAPSSNSPTATGQARAIDTAELDAAIAKAEKEQKQKPKDGAANKALVEAYLNRADALTQAAQYRQALGDYRRALKLDPNNQEAKQWIDQITGIFKSLNREPPKEGEEPPPLPYKKEA
jgi:tetratricopeptide (TPR) repeat protein